MLTDAGEKWLGLEIDAKPWLPWWPLFVVVVVVVVIVVVVVVVGATDEPRCGQD